MRYTLHTLALSGLLSMGLSTSAVLAQDAQGSNAPTQQDPQAGGPMHHGHAPASPEEQLAHMTKALNLTADQQTQIKPMLEDRRQQMMQIHGDQSATREDRMAKMKTLDDATHSKIAAVLDDKQKAKFQKMAERREEHMEHMQRPGPDGGAQPQK